MLDPHSYLAFVAASAALVLLPGPGQAITIANTLEGGVRAGMRTALGLNAGTVAHACAAGLGLSALLASSATAFSVVKLCGAAYLIYLGVGLLRGNDGHSPARQQTSRQRRPFIDGLAAGILNPKVAIFFLAFLPQFIDPTRGHLPLQFLLLGLTIAVLDFGYEATLALLVARARGRLAASTRWRCVQERLTGGVLVLLGVRLALQPR